jgi:hypothetical protein
LGKVHSCGVVGVGVLAWVCVALCQI